MSLHAILYIFDLDIQPPGKKLTALCAANFVGPDGCACPGYKRLARMSGQSVRTVERHLEQLFTEGVFHRVPRPAGVGRNTPSWFRLNAPPERLSSTRSQSPGSAVSRLQRPDTMAAHLISGETTNCAIARRVEQTNETICADTQGLGTRHLSEPSIEESDSESVSESIARIPTQFTEGIASQAHAIWGRTCRDALIALGDGKFKSWIADLQLVAADGRSLTLGARTSFHRDYVRTHLADELAKLSGMEIKVTVVPRSNMANRAGERRSPSQNPQNAPKVSSPTDEKG